MASHAPVATVTPLKEFTYFQALPMELQCMIWSKVPLEPAFVTCNQHVYPTRAEVDSPRGLYGNDQMAFRQRVMKLCKSAWLSYATSHKLYYVLHQADGGLLSVTKKQIIPGHPANYGAMRFNPKAEVLSRQFELIRGQFPNPDSPSYIYPQRRYPVRGSAPLIIRQEMADWLASNGGFTQLHTPENPNLLRHIHIDLLIRKPGSTPTVVLGQGAQPSTLDEFLFTTCTLAGQSCSNLRTITMSLNGPGALHKVIRLVRVTPPSTNQAGTVHTGPAAHQMLPAPVWYHSPDQSKVCWSRRQIRKAIRTDDGALIIRPQHLLRNQSFALLRVVTPLGPKIDRNRPVASRQDWPLETFHNDEEQWRGALQKGWDYQILVMSSLSSQSEPDLRAHLLRTLSLVIETGRGAHEMNYFRLDGICGPNYAMEDAKVFR